MRGYTDSKKLLTEVIADELINNYDHGKHDRKKYYNSQNKVFQS